MLLAEAEERLHEAEAAFLKAEAASIEQLEAEDAHESGDDEAEEELLAGSLHTEEQLHAAEALLSRAEADYEAALEAHELRSNLLSGDSEHDIPRAETAETKAMRDAQWGTTSLLLFAPLLSRMAVTITESYH